MSREMTIIEVVSNDKVIGHFINMNTANTVLEGCKKPFHYRFIRVNENSYKNFHELIRKYYILSKER